MWIVPGNAPNHICVVETLQFNQVHSGDAGQVSGIEFCRGRILCTSKPKLVNFQTFFYMQIVDTAIDCICADCWQTIKTFDEFCQRIGDAHLQAISVDLKLEYASIDDSIPCANLESIVDIKPTASKLQEALAIPVEQPQPLSLNNQTEDKKMFDLALSSCGNDDNNTVFDDIPDTWSDTNSEDYFLTSEDVAKGNSKVTACVNPDGGGPEKDDSVQTVVTGIQTKKQRRKSQETWRPASESKR